MTDTSIKTSFRRRLCEARESQLKQLVRVCARVWVCVFVCADDSADVTAAGYKTVEASH